MLRTRDYVLMLSAIVFLVVGIVSTFVAKDGLGIFSGQVAAVFVSTPEPESYEAVVTEEETLSREERVAALRKKIASLGNLGGATLEESVEVSPVPEVVDSAAGPIEENRCSSYRTGGIVWNSAGVQLEEVEGARLVYKEVKMVASASSTASTTAGTRRDILAQLPVRSIPASTQSCIASDVIGITKNGSLIRNTDVVAYGSFGGETLVGYALDGFPIYGAANKQTDICGGVVEDGQYRYQISNDRETILTCYAGSPISL